MKNILNKLNELKLRENEHYWLENNLVIVCPNIDEQAYIVEVDGHLFVEYYGKLEWTLEGYAEMILNQQVESFR